MAAVTIVVILEPLKRKSVTVSTVSPSICHEVMGPDAMIFRFSKLSFKPDFSPSSRGSLVPLHFLQYLRLLVFLLAILILACASSSLSRVTVYSPDVLLSRSVTSLLSMSSSDCCFLTCIQIGQEAG